MSIESPSARANHNNRGSLALASATIGGEASALQIEGLRVRYGDVEAITGLDLAVERGSVVALLGPNGAGKSSVINSVLGLKQPDTGRIVVAGTSPRAAVRRGLVGAMLQVSGLPHGATVHEAVNLIVALHRGRGQDADRLLASVGLEELRKRDVSKLSGGQAQRIRFALALAGCPEILFLDEPTVGMDIESRDLFWAQVRRLADSGMTILFATHYLAEAERHATRVVMLVGGRLVADGTPAELTALYSPERTVELMSRDAESMRRLGLPGASALTIEGERVRIRTSDVDATMRALYRSELDIRDVAASTSNLDDVFLQLTTRDPGAEP